VLGAIAAGCSSHTPHTASTHVATTNPAMHPLPPPATIVPQLDARVAPLIDGDWVAGAVVGLISGPDVVVRSYGHVRDGGPAPDEHTLFEIGSLTKTFTALALADMIARHDLAIDTPAQALLPDGVTAPGAEGRPILLIDLATHLSGLPRLPERFVPADPANPYADFHDDDLLSAVRAARLSATPGTEFEYSNFGYGLLGWLLARHAHVSYAQLIADHITSPLGMSETTVALDASQRERFAQGHDADGDAVPAWDMGALAGAGAIRSSVHDMVRFVRFQLDPEGPLANAAVATHVLRHEIDSPPGYVAMGWHVLHDRHTLWHNGGTGGFHSYVAFDPRRHIGVVVLANSETAQVDRLGVDAMHLLRGQPSRPLVLPQSIALDDTQLERYAGTYEIAPGARFVVTHAPRVLRARLGNQPAFRIHPESATEFQYRVVEASLTFELPTTGPATALTLHQNGRDLRAVRVSP
jgi:CubicO group peptidase (beta-lactamase class C family)